MRGGFRGGRGGPPPFMRGPPMGGRGGPRGGRGGPRGGRGGPRNAPYPPPRDSGYGRGYQDFAEDDYEPRRGGGPMRGPDSYSGGGRRDYGDRSSGGGYGGGRGGYGGGRGGGGSEMYSRRSPPR